MSTLVIGLTEEQKERMYAYEKECDVREAREEAPRLTKYLLAQNRSDDLIKALEDEDFRDRILSEINR